MALFSLTCVSLFAQQTISGPPASDGLAAKGDSGAVLFRSSCGFCHGSNAQGAQGPNLTTSRLFATGTSLESLQEFLKAGRPEVGMPPFPGLTSADLKMMRSFVEARRSEAAIAPLDPAAILVGDAAEGRLFFEGEGECAKCHSVTSDLKGIGSRFDAVVLQGRMLNPRVVGRDRSKPDAHPARVVVSLPGGKEIEGSLLQISDFFVTFTDEQGTRRTIPRDNDAPRVTVHDPADFHRQMLLKWTDKRMHDVTAYLASLK